MRYLGLQCPTQGNRQTDSKTTRENGIKPKKRYEILCRANHTCELCNKHAPLDVDHLISVDEMKRNGYGEEEYNADWNLAALCEECNSGKSNLPMPINILLSIQIRRLKARSDTGSE